MPLREFWYEDPNLLWVYRTSFINRKKDEIEAQQELINLQSWLTGMYVAEAIGATFGKGHKYPAKPYNFGGKEEKKEDKKLIAEKVKAQAMRGMTILEKRRNKK